MPQLSRNISPLLKSINGRPRNLDVKAMEEPEDVTAPPISSDEDDAGEPDFGDPHYDSSDDEPTRGDIGRSDFKPSTSQKPSIVARGGSTLSTQDNDDTQRRSARPHRKRAVEIAEDPDADESGVSSAKKRPKTTDSTHTPFLGTRIGDGFLVNGKTKPPKAVYGKKAAKAKHIAKPRGTTPNPKFERPRSMSESVSPNETRKFKILSPGSEASSPYKKPGFMKPSRVTTKERSSSLSDVESDDVLSDPPRPVPGLGKSKQNQKLEKNAKRYTKKAAKKKSLEHSADEGISQRAEFKMPEGYNDFASTIDRAAIDMPLYQDTETDKKANLGPDQAPCPMCDEPVDKQWLSEYSKGQRMSIARQAKFCHQHKKRTARELWKTKGYPDVDWAQLEARIAAHLPYLESLINGAECHFGERLRDKIRTGKNRTLFTTDEYPVPGYYGLRGMSAMTESIVDAFAPLLRERAPRDRLISARGHTAYVQSVLVPELGARLIREDMGIADDAGARAVMRESKAVGVILNDERGEQQRAASQAQADARAGSGSEENGDEASIINHDGIGMGGGSEGDEEEVDLRIQRVNDSDSDASSLLSLRGHGSKSTRKGRLAGDGYSEPGKLASLGRTEEPIAPGRDVEDSDSDLSSLASLDKL